MLLIETKQLIAKLTHARFAVVLTGAGVSTAAGIPDFRGTRGIYTAGQYTPASFNINAFLEDPKPFYQFAWDFLQLRVAVRPTQTHRILAELESQVMIRGIITQNIDGLHQEAGSKQVLELHGSYSTATCTECEYRNDDADIAWWVRHMAGDDHHVARCDLCRNPLKPGIVFFGESVHHIWQAESLARRTDLLLILGSSLSIYPAALLPQVVEGDVVIINNQPVEWSGGKQIYFLESELDPVFKQIAKHFNLR